MKMQMFKILLLVTFLLVGVVLGKPIRSKTTISRDRKAFRSAEQTLLRLCARPEFNQRCLTLLDSIESVLEFDDEDFGVGGTTCLRNQATGSGMCGIGL
jgi:hypothetical protein